MRKPRRVDALAFEIKEIKQHTCHEQSKKCQKKNTDMEISHRHSRMIQRKQQGTEKESERRGNDTLEHQKSESAEKDLLKKGIDERNIQRNKNEILRTYTRISGQFSDNARKIENGTKQEVSKENKAVYENSPEKRFPELFSFDTKESFDLFQLRAVYKEIKERNHQKQDHLDHGFDKIRGLDDRIDQAHSQSAKHHRQDHIYRLTSAIDTRVHKTPSLFFAILSLYLEQNTRFRGIAARVFLSADRFDQRAVYRKRTARKGDRIRHVIRARTRKILHQNTVYFRSCRM